MSLPSNDVEMFSDAISKRLIEHLNWDSFKSVHCYEEIKSLNEISTAEFREHLNRLPHINVILQDKNSILPDQDQKYDLVIVPTLGFDAKGNRLGWGGGYYDKLLAKQTKALKVGLCYQVGFVVKGLPAEPHDIPLDMAITESKSYKFNSV